VPILWNLEGLYGWIPIEAVKNEVNQLEHKWCLLPKENSQIEKLHLTWQQAYRLRQDVGRMLEAQDNIIAGLSELLNEKMLGGD